MILYREVWSAPAAETARWSAMPWRACRSACPPSPTPSAPAAWCWIRCCGCSRPTSWRPNGCTAMTRLSPSWRSANATSDAAGSMCATTSRLAAPTRRRQCSTTRATVAAAHPQLHLAGYRGILQADAFSGYAKLYEPQRSPGSIQEAACWVHARRPFFAMADLEEKRAPQGSRQEGHRDLADCHGDRAPDRRPVRDRADHQWRNAPSSAKRFARRAVRR